MNDKLAEIAEVVRDAYERSQGWLYRYLSRRLNRPGEHKDVADLAQDVYLKLLEADSTELEKDPERLVGIIAHRLVVDYIRKTLREKERTLPLDDIPEDQLEENESCRVEDSANRENLERQRDRALSQFSTRHRRIYECWEMGMTYKEIAAALNIPDWRVTRCLEEVVEGLKTMTWDL